MVIKTFSDGTQMLNTNRYEQYPNGLVRNNSNWDEFREQANVELLMRYTKWLDRRGFFREDLQCDFEHQIETFLNDFNVDN
jgi:hypothetical protein